MFYRTDDLIHSRRVCLLVNDISEIAESKLGDTFNREKALRLALVHDDAEIITGDVQLYKKDRMTEAQLEEVHVNEARAIEVLSRIWPENFGPFSYRDLLYHSLRKDCVEAQVVSYCDKVDAYGESLHEVLAGNPKFRGPAKAYVNRIRRFPDKFPDLAKIFPLHHSLLAWPQEIDVDAMAGNGRFHDSDSIKVRTGIPHYDRWKEITIENFGLSPLIEVKER